MAPPRMSSWHVGYIIMSRSYGPLASGREQNLLITVVLGPETKRDDKEVN